MGPISGKGSPDMISQISRGVNSARLTLENQQTTLHWRLGRMFDVFDGIAVQVYYNRYGGDDMDLADGWGVRAWGLKLPPEDRLHIWMLHTVPDLCIIE